MTSSTTVSVDLPTQLLSGQLQPLQSELLRALRCSAVELNAGAVVRADTAGIQLLLAFIRSAVAAGVTIDWRTPSEVLHHTAEVLGLDRELQLPVEPGSPEAG